MGMFDELKCVYPLPDAAVQDEVFQTKSFDCELTHRTITADGRLIRHAVCWESVIASIALNAKIQTSLPPAVATFDERRVAGLNVEQTRCTLRQL
jgi:hypothetical protein